MARHAWNTLSWLQPSRLKAWVAKIHQRIVKLSKTWSLSFRRKRRRVVPRKPARFVPQLQQLEPRLVPASIVVNTASDSPILPPGTTSLRSALVTANADAAAGTSDTITFNSSLNGDTISLTQGVLTLSGAGSGTITINGGNEITVSGNNSSEVFKVDSGVSAVFTGLTIEDGSATDGGGINNAGTLTLNNSTITSNAATYGAGIYNTGTLRGTTIPLVPIPRAVPTMVGDFTTPARYR